MSTKPPPRGRPPAQRGPAPARGLGKAAGAVRATAAQGSPAAKLRPAVKTNPGNGPGCLASLFLDLTGFGFLLQMKRKLGGPLFLLAFIGILGLMFVAGLKIERYGHLGEAQYILQILPLTSCLSPVLAFLMAIVFGIGDCLTTATYWLFPQDSNLNMFHLFNKAHPLLTWGAYARMDFITLPLYAILPGLGSRIAYGIASRLFQAGRAKIMKDGGAGDPAALKQQLSQALSDQRGAAQSERTASGRFEQADAQVAQRAAESRAAQGQERDASAAVQSANADTQRYNQEANRAREAVTQAVAEADAEGKAADRFESIRDRADADLRMGSLKQEELQGRLAGADKRQEGLDTKIKESQKTMAKLDKDRAEIQNALDTGVDAQGRPMTPERMEAAKKALEQNLSARQLEEARVDFARSDLEKVKAEKAALDRSLAAQAKENDAHLKAYRDAAAKAEAARRKQEQVQEQIRSREAARDEARRNAAASQEKAKEEMARLEQARQERTRAEQAFQAAVQQRNAATSQLNAARADLGSANSRVAQIQSALGVPVSPPVPPANPALGLAPPVQTQVPIAEAFPGPSAAEAASGARHRKRPDPYQDVIREYDKAMYAAQAERQRWRDQLVRDWQARNQGLLPSGVGPADFGGGSVFAGQSMAALAAAAAGGVAGSVVGAGLLHGHMWAEYNPIRVALHPSHSADVGCFKMDVGYLDSNMLGGVGDAAVTGPIGVIAADAGSTGTGPAQPPPLPPGSPPPGGPGSIPGGPGPVGETPEGKAAREEAQKAREEADKYKKQFEDSEASADKSDPNYEANKKQYDDYIKSQEDKASQADAQADAIKAQREADEAAAAAAKANKEEWIRNRQDDLKAAAEEKAHLEAVMIGAQQAGLNTSEHQTRLNQLNQRLGDLHGQLQKEGGDIDYTARDRGVISPGKEFLEAPEKARQQKAELDYLQKMQRAAFEHGMLEPGADGTKGDMYGRVGNQIDKLLNGEKLDPNMIKQIRDSIGHRIDGTTADASQLPHPEKPWYTDGESWKEALNETGRNISTVQTSDGKVSWLGLTGRIGIGLLTLGQSEWVFTPAGALYTTKDAIDKGASGVGAVYEGIKETVKQEIGGALIGGLFKTGAAGFKGMAQAELAGENILKGGLKGSWKGLTGAASEGVQGITDVVSAQAWKNTAKELTGSVGSGLKRTGNLLTGEEGLTLGKGASESVEAAAKAKSPLIGTPEWGKQQQIRRAAASGDPDVVAGLYREGGMKDLIDMQKKGLVSADEARKINTVLREEVNQSVRQGTKDAIEDFQSQTGVKVKEVLVGDSGSSAKGSPSRLKTDADRTTIATFDDASVKDYATKRGISQGEAYDELSKKFSDTHQSSVDQTLRNRTGLTANDVDYKTYDRIGGGSGKCDSYAEGFTNSRQAGQGSGEKYTVNADGTARDPVKVSGQTVVDQNQLNKAKYDPDYKFPEDPTKIPPREIPSVLEQQTDSLGRHPDDPLTVAKALGRTEKIANTVGESLGDPRLTQAAKEIYENPGNMDQVLKNHGFVDAHGNPDPSAFCNQGSSTVVDYSAHFPRL